MALLPQQRYNSRLSLAAILTNTCKAVGKVSCCKCTEDELVPPTSPPQNPSILERGVESWNKPFASCEVSRWGEGKRWLRILRPWRSGWTRGRATTCSPLQWRETEGYNLALLLQHCTALSALEEATDEVSRGDWSSTFGCFPLVPAPFVF